MAEAKGNVTMRLTRANGLAFNLSTAVDTTMCWLETKPLDFSSAEQTLEDIKKHIKRIIVEIDSPGSIPQLKIYVRYSKNRKDWTDFPVISVSEQPDWQKVRLPGANWFIFKIADEGVQKRWKLTELEIWGEIGGGRQ
jgi:hypothetical protein